MDAINGQPALRFDGEQNMLEVALDINPKVMPNVTVATVFTSQTEDASKLRKVYGHDKGGYGRAAGLDNRGDKNFGLFTGIGVLGYFDLKASQPYLLVDEYSPTSFSGWVNGALTLDKVKVAHGEGLTNFYVGGSGTSYQEFWKGDIAEVLVYDRVLGDSERKQVEDYLASRYKITLKR